MLEIGGLSDTLAIFRLKISDTTTNMQFLIDTGADVSVIPRGLRSAGAKPTSMQLFAANGTPIKVYGEVLLKVNLGLRREFSWQFLIADVTSGIIGADFISHHDLLIDLKRKRLIDDTTRLEAAGVLARTNGCAIKTFSAQSPTQRCSPSFQPSRVLRHPER